MTRGRRDTVGFGRGRQSGARFNHRYAETSPMVAMTVGTRHCAAARMAIVLVVALGKHRLMGRTTDRHSILLAEEGVEGRAGQ